MHHPMLSRALPALLGLCALFPVTQTASASDTGNAVHPALAAKTSIAQKDATPDQERAAAIARAVRKLSGMAPDRIVPSTLLPGFHEVHLNGAVAYVDPLGTRLIRGEVMDLQTGENLTLTRQTGAPARIDIKSLPLADAIKTTQGSGRRTLVVFEDPHCSFCRQLEPALKALPDVTVYRFIVAVLGPASEARARQILCDAKPQQAWADAMAGDKPPGTDAQSAAPAACNTAALARNRELAVRLGIRATPTLLFANGNRVAAALSVAQLEEQLAAPALVIGRSR